MISRTINKILGLAGLRLSRVPKEVANLGSRDAYSIPFRKSQIANSTYYLPCYAEHRPAVRHFLEGRLFEPATHALVDFVFARRKGSLVHAGTFFGDMLPNFSTSVSGRVFAFEPVLENFVLAKLCVEENDLANVLLFNMALTDRMETLRIRTRSNNGVHLGGGSMIDKMGDCCLAASIDQLVTDDIVMIQLDVEGHELVALKGATNMISTQRPIIAIEDSSKNCDTFLAEQGYQHVLDIPGLGIWVAAESERDRDLIAAFSRSDYP